MPTLDGRREPHVDIRILNEIRRIAGQASALGWPWERLWNHRYWHHTGRHPRSLVAVMEPGDEIVEVGADAITILRQRRDLLRFMRTDASWAAASTYCAHPSLDNG